MRWLRSFSLALAALLLSGGIVLSQAPRRADPRAHESEAESAEETAAAAAPARTSASREAAEFRRRISGTVSAGTTARPPRVKPGRDSRRSDNDDATDFPTSPIKDKANVVPEDETTDEGAEFSPSALHPGRTRQVAFEAEQKEAVPDDDWRKQFELQQPEDRDPRKNGPADGRSGETAGAVAGGIAVADGHAGIAARSRPPIAISNWPTAWTT